MENHGEYGEPVRRRLRVVTGEMGRSDIAAIYEGERNRSFRYSGATNSCLVEMDEEPPGMPNRKALETGLLVSMGLGSKVMDAMQVMRKIVVDGSNTAGFQRTMLVSMGGTVQSCHGDVAISSVCLEEDSARKISDSGGEVNYSLDRLGTPLLEISTEPDMKDPDHAMEVARKISFLVKELSMLRRGADSIRQDVNLSLGFGRVEIKGVSRISQIRDVVNYEITRQKGIGAAMEVLESRVNKDFPEVKVHEVSGLKFVSRSRKLATSVESGSIVIAGLLKGMKGLLRNGEMWLGREIADVLKQFGIGGMIHSDELPGYGLGEEDIEEVRNFLEGSGEDAFFIIATNPSKVDEIGSLITRRIRKLQSRDLSETRGPKDNGETYFLRPLAGGERMYPETDLPFIVVGENEMESLKERVPIGEERYVSSFAESHGLSTQDSRTIIEKELLDTFQDLEKVTGDPRFASRLILQIIPDTSRKTGKEPIYPDIMEVIRLCREMDWPRYAVENAVSLQISLGRTPGEVAGMKEAMPLNGKELQAAIEEIRKSEEVTRKNVIFLLKKKTMRPFDASEAMTYVA